MPSRSLPRNARRLLGGAIAIWSLVTLVLYVALRDGDVRPMFAALGARALDLALPSAFVLAYLPAARLAVNATTGAAIGLSLRLLFAVGVAFGFLIVQTTVLGFLGRLDPWWLAGVPASIFLASARGWCPLVRDLKAGWREAGPDVRSLPGTLWGITAVAALLLGLTPETSQDALHYHLTIPRTFLEAGGIVEIPGCVYSRFPLNVEMLFLNGLAVRGEIAAKAFHWLLALSASVAVFQLALRFASRTGAAWAALIFLSTPTVFRVATWAYVEMGLVLFLILGWIACLSLRSAPAGDRRSVSPLLIGFFLGLAAGSKYTMLLPVVMIAGLTIAGAPRRLATTVGGTGAGLLGGGAWYLRNWIELGNPLFPFFYHWWGGPGWDAERARLFESSLAEWGTVGWDLPFTLTFEAMFASAPRFDGIIGPVFLLGLPLLVRLVVLRADVRSTTSIFLVLLLGWLVATHQMRFLVPALAVLSALIPAACEALPGGPLRRWTEKGLAAGVILALVAPLLIFSREAPLAFALGLESESSIRARNLPGGDARLFEALPEVVPPEGKVLFAASGNPVFLCRRPYHADSVIENYTLRRLLREGKEPLGVVTRFRAEGFTHLLFRFPLVFGAGRSDLTEDEKMLLHETLNRFGSLELRSDATLLYSLGVDR